MRTLCVCVCQTNATCDDGEAAKWTVCTHQNSFMSLATRQTMPAKSEKKTGSTEEKWKNI